MTGRAGTAWQTAAALALVLAFLATTRWGQPESFLHYEVVEVAVRLTFILLWWPLAQALHSDRAAVRALLGSRWVLCLIPLAAWIGVGMLVHANTATTLSHGSTLLGLLTAGVAIPFAVSRARDRGDGDPARFLRWATYAIAAHLLVLAVCELVAPGQGQLLEDPDRRLGLERFSGLFRLATTHALFLLPFFLLAQEQAVHARGSEARRRSIAVVTVLGVGLLATLSRSAVPIVLASSVVAVGRAVPARGRRRWTIAVASVLALAVTALVLAPSGAGADAAQIARLGPDGLPGFLNGRIRIWGWALVEIGEYPVFGTGTLRVPFRTGALDPHNLFLNVAYTHGIPGLALLALPSALYLSRWRRGTWLVLWIGAAYLFRGGYLLHVAAPWIVMTIVMGLDLLREQDAPLSRPAGES